MSVRHRYVEDWEQHFECSACACAIGADDSVNGAGRCQDCFDALTPGAQDRLREQDVLLFGTLLYLYPRGIEQSEG